MSASAMGNPGQCIYSPHPLLPANSRHHTLSSANKCFCAKVRFQIYLLGSSLGGAGARLTGAVAPGPSTVPGSHSQRGRVRGCGSALWGRWRVGCGLHRLAAVRASVHTECAAAVLRIRGACAYAHCCSSWWLKARFLPDTISHTPRIQGLALAGRMREGGKDASSSAPPSLLQGVVRGQGGLPCSEAVPAQAPAGRLLPPWPRSPAQLGGTSRGRAVVFPPG